MDGLVDQLDYLDVDDSHQSSFLFINYTGCPKKRYAAGATVHRLDHRLSRIKHFQVISMGKFGPTALNSG